MGLDILGTTHSVVQLEFNTETQQSVVQYVMVPEFCV